MGLDAVVKVDGESVHHEHMGSYGGYGEWRRKLAKAVGIDLDKMKGFGGVESWRGKPMQLILNHSDCEDRYTHNVVPQLLEEAKEAQRLFDDDYDRPGKFIRLCEKAIERNVGIMFC